MSEDIDVKQKLRVDRQQFKKMIEIILMLIVFCLVTKNYFISIIHRLQRNGNLCGVPVNIVGLIIQGQNFTRGSFPWIVALMQTRSSPPEFFCAGTLISKTFVISGESSSWVYWQILTFNHWLVQLLAVFFRNIRQSQKNFCLDMFALFLVHTT